MKYLNKIKDVFNYSLLDESIYIFNNEGDLIKWNNNSFQWKSKVLTQFFILNLNEDYVLAFSPFNKIQKIKKHDGSIINTINEKIKPIKANNTELLCVKLINTEIQNTFGLTYLANLNLEEIKTINTDIYIPVSVDSYFCYCQFGNNQICVLDLVSENIVWKKYFSNSIVKIETWNSKIVLIEIIGEFSNKIIALNANNGSTLWEKDAGAMILKNNQLYFLEYSQTSQVLKEYNLQENIEQQYDITKIIIDHFKKIPFFLYTVEDNYMHASFTNEKTIITINLKTILSESIYEIETFASQIDKPQVKSTMLYILDSNKTLHIFEKE